MVLEYFGGSTVSTIVDIMLGDGQLCKESRISRFHVPFGAGIILTTEDE